jgi:pimeloyl-ACP methyl ester carboxylesterase
LAEERICVAVADGELHGHRGGDGPPALLLHGGPAVPDYTAELAAELGGRFHTIRYTQRGAPPSSGGPPYTIERHMDDALAVLDAHRLERAWIIGHSWGGHLALHLAVAHPQRVAGLICVGVLGARTDAFGETGERLMAGLTPDQRARVDEIEAAQGRGVATEADLVERYALLWPQYFADPARAAPAPERIGARCLAETKASLEEHFERGTLARGLPGVAAQVAFVHGELDPLPPRSALDTAVLIPGASTEIIPGVGHFPWLERPGSVHAALEKLPIG